MLVDCKGTMDLSRARQTRGVYLLDAISQVTSAIRFCAVGTRDWEGEDNEEPDAGGLQRNDGPFEPTNMWGISSARHISSNVRYPLEREIGKEKTMESLAGGLKGTSFEGPTNTWGISSGRHISSNVFTA